MQTLDIESRKPKLKHWKTLAAELGAEFESRADEYDLHETFAGENYEKLKSEKVFSLAIPAELGGGNISHSEMCHFLNLLARHCSSTALALSMHQHLVAANTWKYRKGMGGEAMLKKVSDRQLVLVSTGAGDWLSSNGEMKKVNGGYLVSGKKHFASQALVGDVLATSARFNDPAEGWQVLHFAVPFGSEGLHVEDTWHAMGMRATGSHTVVLNEVFVPDDAIVLKRPMGEFHIFWGVVLTVAMPLIMSVYVGIAEKAAEIAMECAKKANSPNNIYLLGEMSNELTTARVMWNDMTRLANDLDFEPSREIANEILMRKTITAKACINTVSKAMEIGGGQSYLRKTKLERLFRDVNASVYHPLQEKPQHEFTGKMMMEA